MAFPPLGGRSRLAALISSVFLSLGVRSFSVSLFGGAGGSLKIIVLFEPSFPDAFACGLFELSLSDVESGCGLLVACSEFIAVKLFLWPVAVSSSAGTKAMAAFDLGDGGGVLISSSEFVTLLEDLIMGLKFVLDLFTVMMK